METPACTSAMFVAKDYLRPFMQLWLWEQYEAYIKQEPRRGNCWKKFSPRWTTSRPDVSNKTTWLRPSSISRNERRTPVSMQPCREWTKLPALQLTPAPSSNNDR